MFNNHRNSKKRTLGRATRDPTNRMRMNATNRVASKAQKSFTEKTVRDRSNGKRPKIPKSEVTVLLRDKDNFKIKPAVRKDTSGKNMITKLTEGTNTLRGEKFVVSNVSAIKTRGSSRTRGPDNLSKSSVKSVKGEVRRANISMDNSPGGKSKVIASVVELGIKCVNCILHFDSAHGPMLPGRRLNDQGEGQRGDRSLNPFSDGTRPNGSRLVLHTRLPNFNGSSFSLFAKFKKAASSFIILARESVKKLMLKRSSLEMRTFAKHGSRATRTTSITKGAIHESAKLMPEMVAAVPIKLPSHVVVKLSSHRGHSNLKGFNSDSVNMKSANKSSVTQLFRP